jgi:hypothetical protein
MHQRKRGKSMKFKVGALRLQESKWDGYFLVIDFSPNVSTSIKISKKRYLDLIKTVETLFPQQVIE